MSLDALTKPSCEFFGGPWDGRKGFFSILGAEMVIPDVPGCAVMELTNHEINHPRRGTKLHVYVRRTLIPDGTGVYAKYFYTGVR